MTAARYLALRIQRTPRQTLALWCLLSALSLGVLIVRYQNAGASHALTGFVSFLYAPLSALTVLAVWGSAVQGEVRGLLALGRTEREVALAFVVSNVAASAAAAVMMTETVLLAARGSSDPSLLPDAITSFGVATLIGASYGAYFSLAALQLRNTRVVLLFAFALVCTVSAIPGLGLLFPYVHTISLLGGAQAEGFHDVVSERGSSLWLCGSLLFFSALSVWRITRARSWRV
jgi:hypothetical protein